MIVRHRFFSVRQEVDFTTVTLSPDLGDTLVAEELMHQLATLIDEIGKVKMVIDFADADACPSAVIAALVAAQRQLQALGGHTKLSIPSERIRAIFQRLNLNLLFDIYPNPDDAISAWQKETNKA